MKTIRPGCWSEHGELEAVIVCPPSIFDIPNTRIAADVNWSATTSQDKAMAAYLALKTALEDSGAEVFDYSEYLFEEELKLNQKLINRFFVRDLACVLGNTIIPGVPGISMRRPEYFHAHRVMKTWFSDEVFLLNANDEAEVMEFGDLLLLNKDSILINVGLRTTESSVKSIRNLLFQIGFSEIGLIDLPRRADTLHLDMNCNVANQDLMISKRFLKYYPVRIWTESGSRFEMYEDFIARHGFEIYWIDEYDPSPDLNFFHVNPETMLISTKANKRMLRKHPKLKNKNLIEVDVAELEKGGGGIRCMTLPLRRKPNEY